MPFLNILNNLRAKASGSQKTTRYANGEPNNPIDENAVLSMMEMLYEQMITVMSQLPEIEQDDFDLAAVRMQLLLPVARYVLQQPEGETRQQENMPFLKPLFISGVPGIGKTTLLMILDEVLYHLNRSCRDMVVSGNITGYFTHKAVMHVTPLRLFGKPTGMLSTRDWNNILRHWTFDEATADHSEAALRDFISHLQGKIVIMDEAELEGYVYVSELLARHGILVILSSNLKQDQIHLPADHVQVISLHGSDHRVGDISKVCLPSQPHELFDLFATHYSIKQTLYVEKLSYGGSTLVYYNWGNLKSQPLMKDDFARLFADSSADAVLLDAVPFFEIIPATSVNLTFLGHLSRFVNFVDAIHDSRLPLLVRGTQPEPLDAQTTGNYLRPLLMDYDRRVGGYNGEAAWIEWTRCLSRLKSREAINAQVWPMAKTLPIVSQS